MKEKTEFFKVNFDKILEDYANLNEFCVLKKINNKSYYRMKNKNNFITKKNKDFELLEKMGYISKDIYYLKNDISYIKKDDNE